MAFSGTTLAYLHFFTCIDPSIYTKEDEGGLEICAACLVVFCAKHAYIHYNKSSHQFSICVRSVHNQSIPTTPVAGRPIIDSDTISLADSRTEVASEAETDETVVGEPEEAGDVQCALRCWQCGVDGEGFIIYVPPEADGANAVSFSIFQVCFSALLYCSRPGRRPH